MSLISQSPTNPPATLGKKRKYTEAEIDAKMKAGESFFVSTKVEQVQVLAKERTLNKGYTTKTMGNEIAVWIPDDRNKPKVGGKKGAK